MSKKRPKVVRIDPETAWHARVKFTKKKSYVTLVFFIKNKTSLHIILRMTMYLVFEKTNILKLLNSHVNLSTSFNAMKRIVCDLCVSYAFFIGTFLCKIVKKIDCTKKRIQKNVSMHACNGA